MIDFLTKENRHSGVLYFDKQPFCEVDFKFIWNSFNTNEMVVVIDNSAKSLFGVERNEKTHIRCEYHGKLIYEFNLRMDLSSSRRGGIDSSISVPVNEFKSTEIVDTNKIETYDVSYSYPLTKLVDKEFFIIEHPKYGAINGKFLDNLGEEIDLTDNDFIFNDSYNFQIGSRFHFINSKKTNNHSSYFPSRILTSYSSIEYNKVDGSVGLDKINNEAERALNIVSLIERNNINWFKSQINSYDINSKLVKLEKIYRWSSKPTESLFHNNFHISNLRKSFQLINEALQETNEIELFNKVVYELRIATLSHTLEDALVRWHSCLDYFKKRLGFGKNPFSKNLILALESQGVSVADLFGEKMIMQIKEGKKNYKGKLIKFEFNELRDRYIHEGFDVFHNRYSEVQENNRIMRAIAERMLLKEIGIDFTDTHLGTNEW